MKEGRKRNAISAFVGRQFTQTTITLDIRTVLYAAQLDILQKKEKMLKAPWKNTPKNFCFLF
jgi:hypothetical protein